MFRKKVIYLLLVLIVSGSTKAQTFDAPYEIPRFQAFLKECKLQAPTSSTAATSADLINGYTTDQFYVVEDDKIAFNQSGELMRTELRHEINWTLAEGDRSFHGRLKFVEQTTNQVTVVQIHDDANAGSGPNKPLLRIYKHLTKSPVNHLWAAIKTDESGDNTTHIDLGLAPTDYFDWKVSLEDGNLVIDIEEEEKVKVDVSFWTFPSYWKAGVYLQNPGEATVYFDELYRDEMIITSLEKFSPEIYIYPNPTTNILTIDAGNNELIGGSIKVLDITGKVLQEIRISNQVMRLQLHENKGLYLVTIEKEDFVKTVKVLRK